MAMRASCINNIILNDYGNRKADKVESQVLMQLGGVNTVGSLQLMKDCVGNVII